VTVVLHIRRSSGAIEVHELPAEGDCVEVPHGILDSEDVLGFDVEIAGSDRCDSGGAPKARA
jgi:hypothetical protein